MYKYNTTKTPLLLKAYGRNIHQLVTTLLGLKDRVERTKYAAHIVNLMGSMDSSSQSNTDSTQKRWNDLFMLTDYSLDVDSPYPVPQPTVFRSKIRPNYARSQSIKFRSYGRNVALLIKEAVTTKDAVVQEKMTGGILRLMKNFGKVWHHDHIDFDTLIAHLGQMAQGKLPLALDKLRLLPIFSSFDRRKKRSKRVSRSSTGRREKTT